MCRDASGGEILVSDINPASFCLHGGIERTYVEWTADGHVEKVELDRVSDAVTDILMDTMHEYHPYRYDGITHYNDARQTTHADILRTLGFSDAIAPVEAWGMVSQSPTGLHTTRGPAGVSRGLFIESAIRRIRLWQQY